MDSASRQRTPLGERQNSLPSDNERSPWQLGSPSRRGPSVASHALIGHENDGDGPARKRIKTDGSAESPGKAPGTPAALVAEHQLRPPKTRNMPTRLFQRELYGIPASYKSSKSESRLSDSMVSFSLALMARICLAFRSLNAVPSQRLCLARFGRLQDPGRGRTTRASFCLQILLQ
jgi:hypothetical protein